MGKKNIVEEPKTENVKPGKKRGVLAVVIVVLVVALIGAVVGISIYNMSENRVARQLQTAYKYLQEGDYEKAALAFEQVIEVDNWYACYNICVHMFRSSLSPKMYTYICTFCMCTHIFYHDIIKKLGGDYYANN